MKCYAHCLGDCDGGPSREHYISRSVLNIAGSKLQVSGFPWQDQGQQADIGIEALAAKMLCVRHNSSLSPLDTVGMDFVTALKRYFDAAMAGQEFDAEIVEVDGFLFERWLLKVFCGVLSLSKQDIPEQWVKVLFGLEPFPDNSGMHLFGQQGKSSWFFQLVRVISVRDRNGNLAGAKFGLAGLAFLLAFGKPNFEEDSMQSLFRPNGICVNKDGFSKKLQLNWAGHEGAGWAYLDFVSANATVGSGDRAVVLPDERRI